MSTKSPRAGQAPQPAPGSQRGTMGTRPQREVAELPGPSQQARENVARTKRTPEQRAADLAREGGRRGGVTVRAREMLIYRGERKREGTVFVVANEAELRPCMEVVAAGTPLGAPKAQPAMVPGGTQQQLAPNAADLLPPGAVAGNPIDPLGVGNNQ